MVDTEAHGQDVRVADDAAELSDPSAASGACGPRRSRRARWVGLALVVGVAVGLAAVLGVGFGRDPSVVESVHLDQPAPPLRGETLEGGSFDLANYQGQVRVVNVWASWCTACREEHPELIAAARRLASYDVQFVGINFQDRREDALAMLDEMGDNPYPSVVDRKGRIAVDWGVFGVPETFLVDRNGRVRAKVVGAVTEEWLVEGVAWLLEGQTRESGD